MANHTHRGNEMHHNPLDALNLPVIAVSLASWPFLGTLWSYMPTLTGLYMALSASFMLFQMCDKLGLLDRFKRRQPKD